ncbi:MAG: glycosyltransferase, partial [Chloroflexota bacterium]
MNISVIVPTLHDANVGKTLQAIWGDQTRPPDELIVVGLFDPSLRVQFPNIQFVDTKRPVCAAKARNLGMENASGQVFLFTDSDCLPAADWVEKHAAGQNGGKQILGGGVLIDDANYWARSDNVSMFHEFATTAGAGERFLLPTLNMSVHRSVWETVGGMDETFPGAAGEDSDWTIRMRQAGYKLNFDPTIQVRHAPERVTGRDVFRHWYNSGYNNIRVRLRHQAEYEMPSYTKKPFPLRLLSPAIAFYITAKLFAEPAFLRFWTTIPVVYATKVVYCWAAAKSIEDGYGAATDSFELSCFKCFSQGIFC